VTAEAPKVAVTLRNTLPKIKDDNTRAFVEEAISCYENKLNRAAVVLSWVGAVSLLYQHVVDTKLAAFNTEAQRRNPKWKLATTTDDLARMDEYDFLQIAEGISVIGKSVKHELEGALKFRNGCGHPNSLKIGEPRQRAHRDAGAERLRTVRTLISAASISKKASALGRGRVLPIFTVIVPRREIRAVSHPAG
jgi:hypothetical protein